MVRCGLLGCVFTKPVNPQPNNPQPIQGLSKELLAFKIGLSLFDKRGCTFSKISRTGRLSESLYFFSKTIFIVLIIGIDRLDNFGNRYGAFGCNFFN